jgi:xylulokinase
MEGVAFSLRDTFSLFSDLKIPVTRIRLGGGGARSPLWQQIQADVYGHSVELLAADEGGAFGAALLAGVGIGEWPTVEAACAASVHVAQEIEPRNAATMDQSYAHFRQMYPALREIRRN